MKKILLLVISILFSNFLFSQNRADSLLTKIEGEHTPYNKIELLDSVAEYLKSYSIDSAVYYINLSVNIALDNKIDSKVISQMQKLGKFQIMSGNIDSAKNTLNKCLVYSRTWGDEKSKANILHMIGYIYFWESNFIEALNYYYEALELREHVGDTAGIAASTNNIGLIYSEVKRLDKAIIFFRKAIFNYELLNNNKEIGVCFSNCGMVYASMNDLDSALYYFRKSLKISQANNNIVVNTINYANIGNVFKNNFNYDSAKYYVELAYNNIDLVNDPKIISSITINMSELSIKEEKYSDALNYLNIAEENAIKINSVSLLQTIYVLYANIFFAKEQFKTAYFFMEKSCKYQDSAYTTDVNRQLQELDNRYMVNKKDEELELKEKFIVQQNRELTAQKKSLFYLKLFLATLILSVILITFVMVKINKSYKALRVKNSEILLKNQKIESQNKIISKQSEDLNSNIRYAQDIIQTTLPNKDFMTEYLDLFIVFTPKEIVSGDFYQMYAIDNQIIFILADCAGHGVTGALLAMLNYRIIDRIINVNNITEPSEIIQNLDDELSVLLRRETGENKDSIDLGVIRLSPNVTDMKIEFSGARRELLYYIPKDKMLHRLQATKSFVGGPTFMKQSYQTQTMILPIDTLFYIYSDGVIDHTNNENVKIGRKRFMNKVQMMAEKPLKEQERFFTRYLAEWNKGYMQIDDITLAVFKLKL